MTYTIRSDVARRNNAYPAAKAVNRNRNSPLLNMSGAEGS